jgi:hypothetical protein
MGNKNELTRAKDMAKAFYNSKAKDPKLKSMIAANADDWEKSILG